MDLKRSRRGRCAATKKDVKITGATGPTGARDVLKIAEIVGQNRMNETEKLLQAGRAYATARRHTLSFGADQSSKFRDARYEESVAHEALLKAALAMPAEPEPQWIDTEATNAS